MRPATTLAALWRAIRDAEARGLVVPCTSPRGQGPNPWLAEAVTPAQAADLCRGCPALTPCRVAGRRQDAAVWGGVLRTDRTVPDLDRDALRFVCAQCGAAKGKPCTFRHTSTPRPPGAVHPRRRAKAETAWRARVDGKPGTRARTVRTCSVEGCSKPHKGNGLCAMHRSRKVRGRPVEGPRIRQQPPADGLCTLDDCNEPFKALGRCEHHYQQLRYQRRKAAREAARQAPTR